MIVIVNSIINPSCYVSLMNKLSSIFIFNNNEYFEHKFIGHRIKYKSIDANDPYSYPSELQQCEDHVIKSRCICNTDNLYIGDIDKNKHFKKLVSSGNKLNYYDNDICYHVYTQEFYKMKNDLNKFCSELKQFEKLLQLVDTNESEEECENEELNCLIENIKLKVL